MTDHAKYLRQRCRYIPNALKAIDALLAGHAAEVEQLRQEIAANQAAPHHRAVVETMLRSRPRWLANVRRAWRYRRQLVEARADAETLRQENERLADLLLRLRTSGLRGLGGTLDYWLGEIDDALAAAQEPPAATYSHEKWCVKNSSYPCEPCDCGAYEKWVAAQETTDDA